MAAWEEPVSGPIGSHRLVRLVLRGKSMAEGNPTFTKVLVEPVGLVEVLSCKVKLLDQKVVSALRKSTIEELTTENHATAESGFAVTSLCAK